MVVIRDQQSFGVSMNGILAVGWIESGGSLDNATMLGGSEP